MRVFRMKNSKMNLKPIGTSQLQTIWTEDWMAYSLLVEMEHFWNELINWLKWFRIIWIAVADNQSSEIVALLFQYWIKHKKCCGQFFLSVRIFRKSIWNCNFIGFAPFSIVEPFTFYFRLSARNVSLYSILSAIYSTLNKLYGLFPLIIVIKLCRIG